MRTASETVLRAEHIVVDYRIPGVKGKVHAVSDICLDVVRGETVGIVGESGCGKSTLARSLAQLPPPTSGSVWLEERELTSLGHRELRRTRAELQMIFQDPISSLNPRRRVRDIVSEGLRVNRMPFDDSRIDEVLEAVGLDPVQVGSRRPREFSGGQCQRICIARALVLDPKIVICDEPVSSLDVSVQAQIINLLEEMKVRYGLTLIFIAHDLAVVQKVSDRVIVMYLGKLCEIGSAEDVYTRPQHPYTQALLDAIPEPDPDVPARDAVLAGDPPSPVNPPPGCRFHPRCPRAQQRCRIEEPAVRQVSQGQYVACHFPLGGDATP